MALLPEPEFDDLANNLSKFMVQSISNYLAQRGHPSVDPARLHQLSVPLTGVATEILMFGADLWPELEPKVHLRLANDRCA